MNEGIETKGYLQEMGPKIDAEIAKILSAYPKTSELPESFKVRLQELKKVFSSLSRGEQVKQEGKVIRYNKHTSKVFYEFSGEKINTTIGEIISGMEWGNKFTLNHSDFTQKNDGRKMYEAYVLAYVKKETLALLDEYVLEKEIKHNEKFQNASRTQAYNGIKEKNNADPREMVKTGYIAEKMIQSLLMRLSVDRSDLDFEVVNINAYQDVELKIDFIVKVANKEKGVKTFVTKKVQFSITNDPKKLEIKEDQMAKFKDVVFIHMPEFATNDFYGKWKKNSNLVAGPDYFINKEVGEMILKEITK